MGPDGYHKNDKIWTKVKKYPKTTEIDTKKDRNSAKMALKRTTWAYFDVGPMTGSWKIIEWREPMSDYVEIKDVLKEWKERQGFYEDSHILCTIHFMQPPQYTENGEAYMATLPDVRLEPTGIMNAKERKRFDNYHKEVARHDQTLWASLGVGTFPKWKGITLLCIMAMSATAALQ